jgi:uracil-DNA glycosylase
VSNSELQYLLSALRGYLVDLRETGVDSLPVSTEVQETGVVPEILVENTAMEGTQVVRQADSAPESLEEIRQELAGCLRCSLGTSRTKLVFGSGNEKARLVFVGEAPGREEDLAGEPFVGEAGRLLTKIIQAMGFERDQIYICNVLKCRPPGNRDPLPAEIDVCRSFLLRQVRAIEPEVIVALGTFSAQTLLHTREPISRLRGRFHDYHGIPLMPTFHPAFLLRNPAMKREVWDDMQAVMQKLGMKQPQIG